MPPPLLTILITTRHAITGSILQTISSSAGFFLPFAPNAYVYCGMLSVSLVLYAGIFAPVHMRWVSLQEHSARGCTPNHTLFSKRLLFQLSLVNAVTCTLFVVTIVCTYYAPLRESHNSVKIASISIFTNITDRRLIDVLNMPYARLGHV
jgi:magnesium-transporting ATPase (P-type)